MNEDASRDAIWEHVRAIDTCMMVTRNGENIRARPMTHILRTGQNAIWFFADANDHKDEEVARDPHACLTFADPDRHSYVSLSGEISLVRDRSMIDELWNDGAATYFPQGPNDPRIVLMRFEPESGEYWDSPSGSVARAFRFLKAKVSGRRPDDGSTGRAQLS